MKKAINYLIVSLIIISSIFIYFSNKKEYLSSDDIIGVYVNNELSDKIPSKDEALFQKAICDDDSAKVTWDSDSWGLSISNLNKKIKCNLYFYFGQTVFDFDYTGDEQTFTVPFSGTYKLETWGAQGATDSENYYGGYGGYSIGNIHLIENENLYLIVGGKGQNVNTKNEAAVAIGYPNGGAVSSHNHSNYDINLSSGGGSTHISDKNKLLAELQNDKDSIFIVAGGGGGVCAWWQESLRDDNVADNGGSGGGQKGTTTSQNYNKNNPGSGSQIKGGTGGGNLEGNPADKWLNGSFGTGGGAKIEDKIYNVSGGGGGGYYGGGASWGGSGAGGSGYIGNSLLTNKAMYCYNCEESSEEDTKTISTTCAEETPTSNCAKKGNGYARITLISIDE